ncbi:proprotein convertase subtilisin/kexin type 5-like isoform X1 [Bradysia coprophila]|uniref:proprotein convertase subtilisin/kexin type 5-like isoform X1 n=1 Tax=Bradysia coprophila TaxID=38358 RepID=UPI00187DC10F|nr:proprotein convertase subtilisin/kexin type 5-like isoform X1 [Bradysia coprophila]
MLIRLLVGVLVLGLGELVPNVYSLECRSCSSATLAACATLTDTLPSVTCAAGQDTCYTYLQGELTIRGCELPVNTPEEFSSCTEDNCNANLYPENRLTCHKCSGANCIANENLSVAVACQRYRADDECFTQLYNGIVTRGCMSENQHLVTICQSETICSKCTDNGCNGKTVEDERCVVCDSDVDANCVTNLNETMQQSCPSSPAGMGCYRFDDGGGMIKRGCVGSLLAVEITECRREGAFCKTCTGNNCNAQVDFQKCHECDSDSNVSCIRSPSTVSTQTCRNYIDTCYVHVENNIVTRGCVSGQSAAVQTECARTDSELCETCTGETNCNTKVIAGEFCMECEDCRTNLNHTHRVQCNLAVRQRGCYLFDDGGDIVKRGCINNDLHPGEVTMCRQQGEFCKSCYGNDCNAKETFQRCQSCNSATDVNCIRSGGSVGEVTCRDYMDTCYVHVRDDIVTRGCTAQPSTPAEVRTECQRTNSDFCETCTDNNCNTLLIDGEFCLTCDSAVDPNCHDTLNHTMRTQCNLGVRQLGCYRFDDGGEIVKRGCLSHLISEEISYCRNQGQFCKTCIGDDCNAKIEFTHCKVCNSTQGVECIRSATSVATRTCRNYLDECFIHVQDDVISRGCLQENPALTSDCRNGDICESCNDRENCNDKIVDGEFCITCDSTRDPNCVANLNHTMRTQCDLTVGGMGCYLFDDGGEIIKRGCVSDLIAEERAYCRQEGSFCKTCVGDDCNSQLEYQECVTCSSNSTVNCIRSPGSVPTQTCRSYIDTCFVHVENNIVTRGCLSEQPTVVQVECSRTSSDLCETCAAGNCNNKVIDSEFCMECEDCRTNLNHTHRVQCNLGVRQLGCYLFDDGGDIIKRGCINNDLHPGEVAMCRQQGQFCKTCYGNDCNAKETFQRCRSCNSATDVSCIRSGGSVAEITCRDYMDTCYVNVRDDIVTRGCLAQPSTPTETRTECQRTNSELCETCTANNCNSLLIDGEFCLTCDSQVNPNCRDTLNHTMRTQCNLAVTRRGCYRFDDGGDIIKRGCLSHLISEEISYCRNQGQFCKTCIGDDCNAKIDFQQCRVCNSTNGVECIRSATTVATRTCRNYLDECFVHVQNNITSRGCLQENPNLTNDCRNGDICESCDYRGNCNDKIVNGEFCITCDSSRDPNCVDNLNHTMRTQCSLTVAGMGCYLFDDGGDIIKRGCVSDLIPEEQSYCRQQGSFCKTCVGNDCNSQLRYHQCLTCDSNTNSDCFSPNQNVTSAVCRSYIDTCITHLENGRARRGCSSSRTDLQLSCANDPSLCNTCATGTNCNSDNIEHEFCITCDTEVDANCRSPNIGMSQQCGADVKLNKFGCYRYDDSGEIVKRGCLEDLIEGEIQLCRREGSECKTCVGSNCNLKAEFQRCFTCNSDNNLNCVSLKNPLTTSLCRSYTDSCKTVTLIGGRTQRGCSNELTLTGEQISEECADVNCNAAIFPPNRASCHQCAGSVCSVDLSSSTEFVDMCRNYVANDQCYAFVDSANQMRRGCASDDSPDRVACRAANQQCVLCNSTSCNAQPAFTTGSLSCIQCSNTNVGCAWGHDATDATRCTDSVKFPNVESCFTLQHENNAVTRGCTLATELCNGGDCRTCSGASCNNQNVVTQSCKVCRSDRSGEEQCGSDAFNGFEEQCGVVVKYESRGCFSKREDGVVVRGCAVSLTTEELTQCTDAENEECVYCDGINCNTELPNSASSSLKSILSLALTVLLATALSW